MPPVFAPRWVVRMRVCFLTRFTPSTSTLSSLGYAAMTLPLRPLSRPAMTTTVSPFLTFMALHHLRRQRDDFHVALPPQLPADRAEDTRTTRVAALLDDDGGVLVELDVRAVGAPLLLGGADDDGPDDVALLHAGTRDGVLDGRHDDIADARVAPAGATEYPDAQDLPGSGVVGDAQSRLLLDHVSLLRLPVLRPYRSLAEQSLGPFEDLHDPPPLGGRQRTSLHQQHPVADAALLLVVRLQLAGTAHHLAVQRMLHLVLDRDDDGLLHLVADHVALTDLPAWPLVSRLAHAVSSRSARCRRSRP